MKKIIVSTNLLEDKTDNEIIEDAINSVVREAISYFSHRPIRLRGDDTERYFFKEEEVDRVMRGVPHPEWLKVSIELNEDKSIYCWKVSFSSSYRARATA